MRSAAGNVDHFSLSSPRVRCSVARQLFNLSPGAWLYTAESAPRQLAVTSQLGTPPGTGTRALRAEASIVQNEMTSAETVAIFDRRNMKLTIGAPFYWSARPHFSHDRRTISPG